MNLDNKEIVTARCGLKTNGDMHLGNMLSILTGFMLGKNLSKEGKRLRFIIMLVDLEQCKNQKPFVYENGLSRHSEEIIRSLVSDISMFYPETEVVFCKSSKFVQIESVKNKIIDLYGDFSFRDLISVVCEGCHYTADILEIKGNKINYGCPFCGVCDTLLESIEFALEHTFLGALENYYFKPDIHIIGRDHLIGEYSNIERGDDYLSKMLFEKDFSKKILTPLVLNKNHEKMSKSNGKGLFLSELKRKYGERCIEKIISIGKYCFNNKIKTLSYEKLQELLEI